MKKPAYGWLDYPDLMWFNRNVILESVARRKKTIQQVLRH